MLIYARNPYKTCIRQKPQPHFLTVNYHLLADHMLTRHTPIQRQSHDVREPFIVS